MEWYPWLNVIYSQILSAYQINKGHHFLLIQSTKDNGLDSLIYALSRWLMCFNPVGIKSCKKCRGCVLMKSCCHPDYYSLQPDGNIQSIGIDKVRMLIEKLYQYAYVADLKIVYIKNSEWLTEEAVNSLLKIFEEPPKGVYFFLGCRDFTRLLPTFLSRCLRWKIMSPKEKVGLQWLYQKGINNMEATVALRLCDGAPLEAYSVLKSNCWKLRLELCKELKNSINKNNFLNILPVLIHSQDMDQVLVSWLCSFFIDALKLNQGICDFLVNIDHIELIRHFINKFSISILNNHLQQWLICLRYLENVTYINRKALLAYQLLNTEGKVLNFSF